MRKLELEEAELMLLHTKSVYTELHPRRSAEAMNLADSTLAMGVFLDRQMSLYVEKLERRIERLEAKLLEAEPD